MPRRTVADLQLALRRVIADAVLTNDRVARRHGLTVSDSQALHLLDLADRPMTPGQLGAVAGLASSSTTRTVDRLERAGFVRRVADPHDRRKIHLETVPARMRQLAAEYDELAGRIGGLLAEFTSAEVDAVARFLEALVARDEPGEAER